MLVVSAFFSGLEIAFLSANRLRVELMSNQGARWAQLCSAYYKQPSRFISTVMVGNNIALVVYGLAMAKVLNPFFVEYSALTRLLSTTTISTFIVLLTAEFMPKSLFRINPTGILAVLIFPFQMFYYFLWPFVQVTLWLAKNSLFLLLRKKFTEETPSFSKMDLDHYLSETGNSEDAQQEIDTEILKNALDFGNVKVRECMVPRTSIVAMDFDEPMSELQKLFEESRHSKILVYKESIDNIIGYVHHIDLFKKPASIKMMLKSIHITNESKPAHELLKEFTKSGRSIALVVDEFGGTAGIVTVEDIMEEIFGEIEDEHDDSKDIIERKTGDDEYEFSASLEVDYLNETYDLKIPMGEYETLGGFIYAWHESIPSLGQTIVLDNFEITILKADEKKMELVRLKTINE